ncbi:ABC transporter ATP-binding protein [Actinoallomurus bryophytorum]|uniref:Amino acid/amide ABC transporter ATP-binding protein 1 (HAAT family) n=1 Tax=Actinoallomurus bryophytorum TaxID=1490222 RepID=A0A543CUR6_9ACTN|nr:ABC transporter ATP-binding protein [Actinoallomurus bryophytorum]TQM00789.1 amino acid/amide ABC transporter ATP-binding protein 1 (HAAT family) [Actinoallomurus bryophytorum]
MTTSGRVALRTQALTKVFRGFRAVDAVDLEVREGGVHALVGPNGAGKTTLFNLLTGFVSPTSGTITVFGEDVTGKRPEQVARRGVARSFQITSLFENLTSREQVELALQGRTGQGFRFWRTEKLLGRHRARVDELLAEVGLMPLADKPAGLLAYGQKRALELALVLALDPRVMLLDEPTAGMGIEDVDRTIELVRRIAAGRTVVFVDHNMHVVGSLADRVTVLQQGKVLVEGPYAEVRGDERVITAYLGEADHA